MPLLEIRVDDLSGDDVRALIRSHLDGMHDTSPAESVHALDIEGLRHPSITFWSAWIDGELAGIGALKAIDARRGELKSMRVDDRFLGSGVGRPSRRWRKATRAGAASSQARSSSSAQTTPCARIACGSSSRGDDSKRSR